MRLPVDGFSLYVSLSIAALGLELNTQYPRGMPVPGRYGDGGVNQNGKTGYTG